MKKHLILSKLCAVITSFVCIMNVMMPIAYADDNPDNDWDTSSVMVVPDSSDNELDEYTEITEGVLTYKVYADHAMVSAGSNEITEIVVPETIQGTPVTQIYIGVFFFCPNLKTITIPKCVTEIGLRDFGYIEPNFYCNLKPITIKGCSGSAAEKYAKEHYCYFSNIETGITSLSPVSGEVNENISWILDENGVMTLTGSGEMPYFEEYMYCSHTPWFELIGFIKEIIFDDRITSITNYAFAWCNHLENVHFPSNLKYIGDSAFLTCTQITSVDIPENVKHIDANAFSGCTELYNINFPDSLKILSSYAFHGTKWFANQPDGIVYAGNVLYNVKGETSDITELVLKEGTLGISDGSLMYCKNLESIQFPESLEYIGASALTKTPWLKKQQENNPLVIVNGIVIDGSYCSGDIVIPSDVKSISPCAFESNKEITSIKIPNCVTFIGYFAFQNCESLESINIPTGIKEIEPLTFSSCPLLTDVTIPNNVETICNNAFVNCKGLHNVSILNADCKILDNFISNDYNESQGSFYTGTITGYNGSTAQAYAEKYNITFKEISEDTIISGTCGENLTYTFNETTGVLTISGTGDMNGWYYGNNAPWYGFRNKINNVIIGNGVTSIGDWAFRECSALTSITIPDSVTSIGYYTFYKCSALESITIPYSVTSTGNGAFYDCSSLTSITIPDSVTSIEESTFYCCSSLTSINIPDSVTSIGISAFGGCTKLESIKILNPECKISDSEYTIRKTATIYGYANSTAQAYAEKYNRNFESFDIYATLPVWGSKTYETVAEIESVSSSDSTVAVTVMSARKTDLSITALQEGYTDIVVKLVNGDVYTVHLTVNNDGTTTSTTPTTISTTTTTPTTTSTTTTTPTTTSTTPTTTTTKIFDHSADTWSFGNIGSNFADPTTGEFFLLQEHLNRLKQILDYTGEYRLEKVINDTKGACYGMSTLAMLNYCNVISPSDIQAGTELLSDVTLTDEVKSVINYHHLLQCSDIITNETKDFQYRKPDERIDYLLEIIEQGCPVVIFIHDQYKREFNHVILAYECTSGQYTQNDEEYDKMLSIYDPKMIKYSTKGNMYINSSEHKWTLPIYNTSYDSTTKDPSKKSSLAFVTGNIDIISANNLFVENNNGQYTPVQYHPDMIISTSDSDYAPPKRVTGGILFGDDDDEYDDVVSGFYFADGDSHDQSIRSYYMRYSEASYQFSFDDGEYKEASLDMRYENSIIDIQANSMNKAVFSPESLKLTALDSNYTIHNVRDNQISENEFYRLNITGKNADKLEFYYESGYWVLSSDSSLNRLYITATNTIGTVTKTFTTTNKNIKIYAEDESTIGIMFDLDDDGIFETPLTMSTEIKLGDVNGDGLVDAIDSSRILSEYSILSTGGEATFNEEQKEAADINFDGLTDAVDASMILAFYSYLSTGGMETDIREWLSF